MMTLPHVVAIMPTTESRAKFAALAQMYFERQSYPAHLRELVIVDGPGTIGAKRNKAIWESRRDAVIVHWDDDDWHHSDRIAVQVQALLRDPMTLMNGMNCGYFFWPSDRQVLRYSNSQQIPSGNPYIMGGTFCYHRTWWDMCPFQDKQIGEDNLFLGTFPRGTVEDLRREDLYVVIRHNGNTGPLATHNATLWQPAAVESLRNIIGKDMENYLDTKTYLVRLSHPYRRHRGDEPTPQAGAVIRVSASELAYLQSKPLRHDEILGEVPTEGETLPVEEPTIQSEAPTASDVLEELEATPIENTKAVSVSVS